MSKSHWLTVEEIRKEQRMRRETVIDAMLAGDLLYEQRGRIRYSRRCDVVRWELSRMKQLPKTQMVLLHPALANLV